jgi:hypothetical protein
MSQQFASLFGIILYMGVIVNYNCTFLNYEVCNIPLESS